MTALRTLAFGDGSVWGASWSSGSAGAAVTVVGAGPQTTILPDVHLPDGDAAAADEWRLEGEDLAVLVSPAGELVDVQAADDGVAGSDQLCRVTGRFAAHDVDCLGLRSWWSDSLDLARFESVRSAAVWFDPAEGFALTAFRPRKAKAHKDDVTAAAVITADVSAPVEDPRLSTTYGADGWPTRAGLELWLAAVGEADAKEEPQQYSRRASGEAIGARAQAAAGELELRAQPFRWHSRGKQGAGMYLLAHRR
ncbi:MAG: hypothetical protein JO130_10130 [Solirubrobacterales bacterium]|nr:hypothetical protein [Solirubrobacterales bacterium]